MHKTQIREEAQDVDKGRGARRRKRRKMQTAKSRKVPRPPVLAREHRCIAGPEHSLAAENAVLEVVDHDPRHRHDELNAREDEQNPARAGFVCESSVDIGASSEMWKSMGLKNSHCDEVVSMMMFAMSSRVLY